MTKVDCISKLTTHGIQRLKRKKNGWKDKELDLKEKHQNWGE